MKNIYKVEWTDEAKHELEETFEYLKNKWTSREVKKLSRELKKTIERIENNPFLFPMIDDSVEVRKVIVLRLNSIYYRKVDSDIIQILSFFGNRQNPTKRTLR